MTAASASGGGLEDRPFGAAGKLLAVAAARSERAEDRFRGLGAATEILGDRLGRIGHDFGEPPVPRSSCGSSPSRA